MELLESSIGHLLVVIPENAGIQSGAGLGPGFRRGDYSTFTPRQNAM
jgi:hypothetical protein